MKPFFICLLIISCFCSNNFSQQRFYRDIETGNLYVPEWSEVKMDSSINEEYYEAYPSAPNYREIIVPAGSRVAVKYTPYSNVTINCTNVFLNGWVYLYLFHTFGRTTNREEEKQIVIKVGEAYDISVLVVEDKAKFLNNILTIHFVTMHGNTAVFRISVQKF